MFMPMNSNENWANGGEAEQTRNARQLNAQTKERTNEHATGRVNGYPNDRVNDQTVHRMLTGETNERKKRPAKRTRETR